MKREFLAPCGCPGEPIFGTFVLCRKCTPMSGTPKAPTIVLSGSGVAPSTGRTIGPITSVQISGVSSAPFPPIPAHLVHWPAPPPLPPKPWKVGTWCDVVEAHLNIAEKVIGAWDCEVRTPKKFISSSELTSLSRQFSKTTFPHGSDAYSTVRQSSTRSLLYDFGDAYAAAPPAPPRPWNYPTAMAELSKAVCLLPPSLLIVLLPMPAGIWPQVGYDLLIRHGSSRVRIQHYSSRKDANIFQADKHGNIPTGAPAWSSGGDVA